MKNTNMRRLAGILLSLCIVSALAACAEAPSPSSTAATPLPTAATPLPIAEEQEDVDAADALDSATKRLALTMDALQEAEEKGEPVEQLRAEVEQLREELEAAVEAYLAMQDETGTGKDADASDDLHDELFGEIIEELDKSLNVG